MCATYHRRFSRKHDLQRHLPRHHTVHGVLDLTSSASSGSAVDSCVAEGIMTYFQGVWEESRRALVALTTLAVLES